jgi:hypothetical protein
VHAACQRPRRRRFTTGGAPRQRHAAALVRDAAAAMPSQTGRQGGASRASQTECDAGEGPRPADDGSLPDTGSASGFRPEAARRPEGVRRGPSERVGRPGGRQIDRTTTAESVVRNCTPGTLSRPVSLGGSPPGTVPSGSSPAAL